LKYKNIFQILKYNIILTH